MTKDEFLTTLPKAELHLHIEGTLEPELMVALARRNGIAIPYASVEDVRAAYKFTDLQSFLDIYYAGAAVLVTEEDFRDLTTAYFDAAAADGVRHAEIFFDPQTHTDRGIPFDVAIGGILAGIEESKAKHGLTASLILSFLRHLSEDAAFDTWKQAQPWLDRIVGIGLDSSEVGHPPSKFERVFAAAKSDGMKLCAHAGEEGPPAYIWEALDVLKVDRIDHGNRALEDAKLIDRLVAEQMSLTVCPLSNVALRNVARIEDHPIDKMLDFGLRASIHSDDPAYFGGQIGENYRAVSRARLMERAEMAELARNSFRGAFLDEATIARHVAAVDAHLVSAA